MKKIKIIQIFYVTRSTTNNPTMRLASKMIAS